MCFLCPGKPPIEEDQEANSVAHDPGPGPVMLRYNPLPPSLLPSTGNDEEQKQQKKVAKKFSPKTTYVLSHSPVNSDSDDTKNKKSKKTSSPDRTLASSETPYASNSPLPSTDHYPKLNSDDSNKPTTRKTGHESKLFPSPQPEKLNMKSTEPSESNTHRFPTSDEVTHTTTESPTNKAQGERNAKPSKTSSSKKLMRNDKEHAENPYKDAASSLHSQTVMPDCEEEPKPPDW